MNIVDILSGLPTYTEDTLPLAVILVVICLAEWLIPHCMGYRSGVLHQVLKIIFATYLVYVLEMTVSLSSLYHSMLEGFVVQGSQMLTPFQEISRFWYCGTREQILLNLCGNVLIFVPMGLIPCLLWQWPRWPWFICLWAVIPTCVVEFLQLFTPRVTSVDDVILNAAGVILGYLLFWVLWLCGLGNHTLLKQRE